MAVVSLLAPTDDEDESAEFVCDGVSVVTVGLYTTNNVPITERVGAVLQIENPAGWMAARSPTNRIVHLTLLQDKPTLELKQAGNYRVFKPTTVQDIGVWWDDGSEPA